MENKHFLYNGNLHPSNNKHTAMIIVTGSDGGHTWANEIAETFASQGITCYSISYWKDKNLPHTLSLIPLEIIKDASIYLKDQGYEKIGIYGISKGAELALVSASCFSEIEFVIAVSPACLVFEGIRKPRYSNTSSWTLNDQPLPYASFQDVDVNMFKNIFKYHEFGFRKQYIEVLEKNKCEENTIKVENINGPILLLSAKNDAQWCSEIMSDHIIKRLKEKCFPFFYKHENYEIASHILCPVDTFSKKVYKVERKFPLECEYSRKRAFEETLNFLKEHI
ncbi:acyl-CoA thioester hydrolase/BAAT C-terminal domain-containing protein [Tannockella kyphosi]|uniref:acyl-CoA thioester hydrolase/BAAT C-terminal domain-containing protein n=1 Tax=Tannockella kyphosi TaxID=2899121 RepID=UPI002012BDC8|nr:acyl-CoA thioester hydrolase/BAAT C-terminal domain-containing protein [Tannockella kyphosi]